MSPVLCGVWFSFISWWPGLGGLLAREVCPWCGWGVWGHTASSVLKLPHVDHGLRRGTDVSAARGYPVRAPAHSRAMFSSGDPDGNRQGLRQMDFCAAVGIPAAFRGTSCLASWNGGWSVSMYVSFMRGGEGREKAGSSVQGKKQILNAIFYFRNNKHPACIHSLPLPTRLATVPAQPSTSWGHRIRQGLISL